MSNVPGNSDVGHSVTPTQPGGLDANIVRDEELDNAIDRGVGSFVFESESKQYDADDASIKSHRHWKSCGQRDCKVFCVTSGTSLRDLQKLQAVMLHDRDIKRGCKQAMKSLYARRVEASTSSGRI